MSRQEAFGVNILHIPHILGGRVRCWKLTNVGNMQGEGDNCEQVLEFTSDVAGGGDTKRTIRGTKSQLSAIRGKVQAILDLEKTALRQYTHQDAHHARFNQEEAQHAREKLTQKYGVDVPAREWRRENDQIICKSQMRMF